MLLKLVVIKPRHSEQRVEQHRLSHLHGPPQRGLTGCQA